MRFFNITIKVKDAKQIKDFKPEEAACASGKLFEEKSGVFCLCSRNTQNRGRCHCVR